MLRFFPLADQDRDVSLDRQLFSNIVPQEIILLTPSVDRPEVRLQAALQEELAQTA